MKSTLLIIVLGTIGYCSQAQSISPSTLNATGGSAAISGNTYEWSIGEMTLVHTATAGSITVTQGLLQPRPAQVGINDVQLTYDQLSVYPNPTDNFVYLETNLNAAIAVQYGLYDVLGKSLMNKEYKVASGKDRMKIDLSPFAAGNYFLKVTVQQQGRSYQNSFEIKKIK
ncbi:T9SS type A sorting domain-containing protein [Taibaiella sp. KBW10]|uniref:T9SS type A sorting domain-containing protein n=1 Tax=Taibaiella sp. KBW10 TaxID=2153357 RepID=UPI0013157943|nr:T9SS type A sorting domain-containing protein [Taibaiella sp. KBW10]